VSRRYDVKLAGLVAVSLLGLAAAGLLGYVTVRDVGAEQPPSASAPPSAGVDTRRVASRAGGFSVRVPRDMRVRRLDGSLFLTAPEGTLSVTVGPFRGGSLREAGRRLLGSVRAEYSRVRVNGRTRTRVGGRPAILSHGRATNDDGVRLSFAVVMVRGRPRNFAITTFADAKADPTAVVPRAEAITRSFRATR